jgi:protein TonB
MRKGWEDMFESIKREQVPLRRRFMTLLVSVTLHVLAITMLVIIPLVFFNVLPEGQIVTFLMTEPAPPPPLPPPPPPAPARQVSREPVVHVSKFIEPTSIPQGVPLPTDEPVVTQLPSEADNGVPGGVSGGVIGGVIGGVPESLLGGPPQPLLPPPPPPNEAGVSHRHAPVVVAGTIEQAKLIQRVPPVYPILAARARIQGVVILQITVDEKGDVTDVRVLRGSPLLDDAAVAAVRQWKYAPTVLDGQPVPVIATVTVNFELQTASSSASN